MTAPAIAPITIEERLATVEATLAAFIAEERVWRNQFVEDQREYRRETNARFDALTATLAEYRQETANAFAEHRRQTNARFDEVMAELREYRRQTDARMDRMYLAIMGFMGAVIVAGVGGVIAIVLN